MSRKGINPYIRPVAQLLSRLVPTAAIVATEKNTLYPQIQVGGVCVCVLFVCLLLLLG